MKIFFCFILLISLGTMSFSQQAVTAAGAVLQKVSDQFSFTEGPAVDKEGNVYFTDQPNDKIWKYVDGKLSLFVDRTGRSNGLYFDNKGNLVACADEHNQLWTITPGDKKSSVLLDDFDGHRFNGPNDLWIDKQGGIYFTDPYFQRDYWTRKQPDSLLKGELLYYLPPHAKQAIIADRDLLKPNGVVGSADGKHLFVVEMKKPVIYKYDIAANGELSNRTALIHDIADGITLDAKGNLYLAGKGVKVYDPSGKLIEHIDVPEDWTSNLCFMGKQRDILFITAGKSIYTIKMAARGIE